MLTFTETATERIQRFLELQQAQGVSALRVAGTRSEHKLWLVKPEDRQQGDRNFRVADFEVFIDPMSATQLEGATVDFVEGVMQSGFRIFFPSPSWDDPLAQQVQDVLDTVINPGVAGHGGSVSLARVEEGVAYITFGGGCQGCGAANVTLQQGVDKMIREKVPEIHAIVDATDHDAGENPYYEKDAGGGESPLAKLR